MHSWTFLSFGTAEVVSLPAPTFFKLSTFDISACAALLIEGCPVVVEFLLTCLKHTSVRLLIEKVKTALSSSLRSLLLLLLSSAAPPLIAEDYAPCIIC